MTKKSKPNRSSDPWDSGALGREMQHAVVVDESFDAALADALGLARQPTTKQKWESLTTLGSQKTAS